MLAFLLTILFLYMSWPVLGNSSWRWLTHTRPWHLLPIAIVLTLFIEIYFVTKLGGVKNLKRAIVFVTLANILSFLSTYIICFIHDLIYPDIFPLSYILEYSPFYNVGRFYLLTTLVVEIPVVYFGLKRYTQTKLKFLFFLVLSNIVTTVIVAGIERIFAYGKY